MVRTPFDKICGQYSGTMFKCTFSKQNRHEVCVLLLAGCALLLLKYSKHSPMSRCKCVSFAMAAATQFVGEPSDPLTILWRSSRMAESKTLRSGLFGGQFLGNSLYCLATNLCGTCSSADTHTCGLSSRLIATLEASLVSFALAAVRLFSPLQYLQCCTRTAWTCPSASPTYPTSFLQLPTSKYVPVPVREKTEV